MKAIKITEAYANRAEIEWQCKIAKMPFEQCVELFRVGNRIDFESVLAWNFSLLVKKGILEEWLPDKLPEVKRLNCSYCPNITTLPEMPKIEVLWCFKCENLEMLPGYMPEIQMLWCYGSPKLGKLPELPVTIDLWCEPEKGDC